jgi:hypothetical protein
MDAPLFEQLAAADERVYSSRASLAAAAGVLSGSRARAQRPMPVMPARAGTLRYPGSEPEFAMSLLPCLLLGPLG